MQDKHGMFVINQEGQKEVKIGLTKSRNILKNCTEYGIYELSEEGLSPQNIIKNG
jgi:hypothetical protein